MNTPIIPAYGKLPEVYLEDFLEAVKIYGNLEKAVLSLGRSRKSYYKYIQPLFSHIDLKGGRTLLQHLLSIDGCKKCSKCSLIKNIEDFIISKDLCKDCKAEYNKSYYENNKEDIKYSARKNAKGGNRVTNRIVAWTEHDKIREFYRNRPEGYHVDHIYPLNGKEVCGLHVIDNLQYLLAIDNLKKKNKMPE